MGDRTVVLTKDRETKGTVIYRDDEIGLNIYVPKTIVNEIGAKETITVTFQAD